MRTDALVLVSSTSADYPDFERFVQPALDNFGVPYVVLDIARSQIPYSVGDYSLLIIGHRQIDVGRGYLDDAEQDAIAAAVNQGTGLVNLDNDLWTAKSGAPRYQFVQSVFNFGRGGSTTGSGVSFSPTGSGTAGEIAIDRRDDANSEPGTADGPLHHGPPPGRQDHCHGHDAAGGHQLPPTATAVAVSGDQPFITVTSLGVGSRRAMGLLRLDVTRRLGPVHGLDDLMWRSLVWAAHKPFVMQALPPIVTMRVDDEKGPFDWIHTANDSGFKPWVGLFFEQVSDADAADLSALTQRWAGHRLDSRFQRIVDARTARTAPSSTSTPPLGRTSLPTRWRPTSLSAAQWHREHNIPISKFVVPHYYEFGTNVFGGLRDWGVEYVGDRDGARPAVLRFGLGRERSVSPRSSRGPATPVLPCTTPTSCTCLATRSSTAGSSIV